MHQHDQDLIMALVEDSLDEAAASSARAEIAACVECSRDLDMQVFARDALHAAPDVGLTELESARLRRSVRDGLGIVNESQPRFEPTKRRRVPIAALATAAAVLVAVVAIAPALNLIGGDSDRGSDATIVADSAPSTTAAPAGGSGLEAPTAVQGDQEDFLTTTLPPSLATTAAPAESAPELLAYYARVPNLDALRLNLRDLNYDEDLTRSQALKSAEGTVRREDAASDAEACLAVVLTNGDEFISGFEFARGMLDERQVIFFALLAEDLEESAVVVLAADNCEELGRAGP